MGMIVRMVVRTGPESRERWVFEAPAQFGEGTALADARLLFDAEQAINRLTGLRVHISLVDGEAS